MFKKDLTIPELEKLEAEDKSRLENIAVETGALKTKRSDILNQMAEAYQTSSPELDQCDASIGRLKIEEEVIKTRLKTFKARKDYARGVEIEKVTIPQIEKLTSDLTSLATDIYKKAAPLIAASNKLFDFMNGFDDLESTRNLRIQGDFLDGGVNGLSVFAPSTSVQFRDDREVDLSLILLAMVYDKEKLTAWLEKTQSSIAQRIQRMREHAQLLKGEDVPSPTWAYCPICYKAIGSPDARGKYRCSNCNKEFDSVPGGTNSPADSRGKQTSIES